MIVSYADAQSVLGIAASDRFEIIVNGVNKDAETRIGRGFDIQAETENIKVYDNQTMIRVSKRLPLNSITSMTYADETTALSYEYNIEGSTGTIWLKTDAFYNGLLIMVYNGGYEYEDMPADLVDAVYSAISFSWRFRDFDEVKSERMGDRTVTYQTGRSGTVKIPDSSIETYELYRL